MASHHPRVRWAALLIASLCLIILSSPAAAVPAAQDTPDAYAAVAENDSFQLYVDSTTLAFKLRDKRSSYVWSSGIDEPQEGDRLNTSWRAFAQSGVSIEYFDQRAVNKRISIANAEHTLDLTPVDQGIMAQVTFTEYGITIGITIQLEADGVRVEVPFDSIQERDPKYRLGRVYLFPFLGATRGGSEPGYMFLPDGTGSLIRFADSTSAKNMFYGRYYGADLGMIASMPDDSFVMNPETMSLPVFGMVHGEGQNAFLTVVEQGAAYGELQVHPAGIITNFNFLYNAFVYNETYFQATNRAGAGVSIIQRQPNQFDAVQHYRFLTGGAAGYVGMAQSYQQYLLDHGRLHKAEFTNPNIGIHLEFLGGDKETVLLWDRFVPMTTIDQVRAMLAGLEIPNPEVVYYGWQPLGATSMPPSTVSIDGALGSVDDLRALADEISGGGGHFSLYLDPQTAIWRASGYSARNDVAMAITDVNITGFNRNYGYYFTLDTLRERYTALSTDLAANLPVGLALDTVGFMLYSDFRPNTRLDRESAVDAYQTLFADSPLRLSFYRPNDYLFGDMQAYYDMPLGDNGYIFTSEAVPFLPIVLAGYVPYYGGALNFSSNRQDDLLRHVEYGIYPSYFLTQAPTANMLNTRSAWIYTSSYDQWGDEIRDTYDWMNALLAPVRGQAIVAHEQVAAGVFATTYANGSAILVNYNDRPFKSGEPQGGESQSAGITVPARDAVYLEHGLEQAP